MIEPFTDEELGCLKQMNDITFKISQLLNQFKLHLPDELKSISPNFVENLNQGFCYYEYAYRSFIIKLGIFWDNCEPCFAVTIKNRLANNLEHKFINRGWESLSIEHLYCQMTFPLDLIITHFNGRRIDGYGNAIRGLCYEVGVILKSYKLS